MSDKYVFSDRDGVLTKLLENGTRPAWEPREIEYFDFVKESILQLKQRGFKFVIVTNQPDASRGLVPKESIIAVADLVKKDLEPDAYLACYHDGVMQCECRKPRNGLFIQFHSRNEIDLKKSWMIGDRESDIQFGRKSNLNCIQISEERNLDIYTFKDFQTSVNYIIETDQKNRPMPL
jgi:D-glycero-D-manno-heptose 1,7-bisphosphate phosphatase